MKTRFRGRITILYFNAVRVFGKCGSSGDNYLHYGAHVTAKQFLFSTSFFFSYILVSKLSSDEVAKLTTIIKYRREYNCSDFKLFLKYK
jgi:hypothetical protein